MIVAGSALSDWADEKQGDLTNDEVFRIPLRVVDIEELELPVRTYNKLMLAGITNIDHLKSLTVEELQRIRNIGIKDLYSIEEALNRYLGIKIAR